MIVSTEAERADGEVCPTCNRKGEHSDLCDHPDGWHDPMPLSSLTQEEREHAAESSRLIAEHDAAEVERAAFEDKCFAAWMLKVDAVLAKRCGLSSADLPDICYRDMYDDGDSPACVARAAIKYAGGAS